MFNLSKRLRPGVFVWAMIAALVVDQVSKLWVEASLSFQSVVPVVPFVSFYRTYNEGIAFSMLEGLKHYGLVLIALGVLVFVSLLWQSTEPQRKLSRLGFAVICGGAIGNIIDRSVYGHVVDFILVHTQSWSFAIFNLADSFITVGAGLVILDEFFVWRRSRASLSD